MAANATRKTILTGSHGVVWPRNLASELNATTATAKGSSVSAAIESVCRWSHSRKLSLRKNRNATQKTKIPTRGMYVFGDETTSLIEYSSPCAAAGGVSGTVVD